MALFLEATFVSEDGKKVLGVCQATGAPGKQVPFKLSAMPGERMKINTSKGEKTESSRSLARNFLANMHACEDHYAMHHSQWGNPRVDFAHPIESLSEAFSAEQVEENSC